MTASAAALLLSPSRHGTSCPADRYHRATRRAVCWNRRSPPAAQDIHTSGEEGRKGGGGKGPPSTLELTGAIQGSPGLKTLWCVLWRRAPGVTRARGPRHLHDSLDSPGTTPSLNIRLAGWSPVAAGRARQRTCRLSGPAGHLPPTHSWAFDPRWSPRLSFAWWSIPCGLEPTRGEEGSQNTDSLRALDRAASEGRSRPALRLSKCLVVGAGNSSKPRETIRCRPPRTTPDDGVEYSAGGMRGARKSVPSGLCGCYCVKTPPAGEVVPGTPSLG